MEKPRLANQREDMLPARCMVSVDTAEQERAEELASRIEAIARDTQPCARDRLILAQRLLCELRDISCGVPVLHEHARRGRRATQALRDEQFAEAARIRAERERALREHRALRGQREAQALYVASQKERVIAILGAATRTARPSDHAVHIRKCKEIWRSIGSAGTRNGELAELYRAGVLRYWRAVKDEPPAPLPEKSRKIGARDLILACLRPASWPTVSSRQIGAPASAIRSPSGGDKRHDRQASWNVQAASRS